MLTLLKSKILTTPSVTKDVDPLELIFIAAWNAKTLQVSLAVSYETKYSLTIQLSSCTSTQKLTCTQKPACG